jgi:hypothetical protein
MRSHKYLFYQYDRPTLPLRLRRRQRFHQRKQWRFECRKRLSGCVLDNRGWKRYGHADRNRCQRQQQRRSDMDRACPWITFQLDGGNSDLHSARRHRFGSVGDHHGDLGF